MSVTDNENDLISYSMTQEPNIGAFTIGARDGIIRTAVDLRTLTVDTVVCNVTVTDGHNTLPAFPVTVRLTNLNERPVISNLPATINVTEDRVTGFDLLTLTFSDDDNVALEPTCSVDPVAENYKFTYEVGTRKLKLNDIQTGETLLDFETTNKYLITCFVYDGFLYSEGDVLTMFVNNVNEPPVFDQTLYFCTMEESNAGVSSCDLGMTVTDPELNTITTLELAQGNNSERFRYDRIRDRLTFNVDYDVDNSNMPTNVIVTIQAVDSIRATGSAKIQINILDANDNTCTFGLTQASQFTIDQGFGLQTLGSFVATDDDLTSPNNKVVYEVVATDDDLISPNKRVEYEAVATDDDLISPNKKVEYDVGKLCILVHNMKVVFTDDDLISPNKVVSGLPTNSLNYLTVFGNGEIKYVGLIPETEHGKSFSIVVRCKDGGTPSLSATATVQAPDEDIWDNEAFVAIFAVLMAILGLALIAALWWFCTKNNPNCLQGPQYERQPRVRPVREYKPKDDFFRSQGPRESPNYRDHAWRTGDHYEDGIGYDGRPITKSDIFLSHNSRALPAPRGYNY
ncbi:hypothetical protein BaRGS_00025629 [Batillaria attramentaria]|uniref:Cadherin domain-containing protein n=1 Tax=Batillaria attramentaria TaxID=370345 RepID=A0ABD0K7U0_9CAEN